MALFGFGKKKEVPQETAKAALPAETAGEPSILVLGSGCKNCEQLEQAVRQAIDELGFSDQVGHVKDFAQIAAYGVMTTPALVVDGKVVSAGRVLSREQAADLLRKARET